MATKSPPKPAPVSTLKGRDARTGLFIPVEKARRNPDTSVVERVPKPGHAPK